MSSTDEKPPAKLWEHVLTVFAAMQRQATSQMLDGKHALVYTGHTTQLFRDVGLATPYYTSVMRTLKQMGCVRQLSRGGGSAASRWELLDDPDLETFEVACASQKSSKAPSPDPNVLDLEQRMHRVEDFLGLGETGS